MQILQRLSRLGSRSRLILGLVLLVVLVLLIYPFKTEVVPEWRLRVVDDSGQPVAGINVTEHWQHYLFESAGHEHNLMTADDGSVTFPARMMRANFLRWAGSAIRNVWRNGKQARISPYAAVVVWGSAEHATSVTVHRHGTAPQPEIVASRLR